MSHLPRISIVTTSYNQGAFIGETIESVLAQGYPDIEHIIVDGMSTDNTPDVLSKHGHLRVVREPDKGAADAINKGFRIATGEIWCFLHSDDTLLPGALHRVAREINPGAGRHVVMGRCRFVDEHGKYFGVEHPCHYESFRRVLEVWKGHFMPQPSVFFTPEVWKNCGPLEVGLVHFDYDLFCRFARRYRFYVIDQVLANYRLHPESHTVGWSEADRLEDSIRLSRRYWGSPLLPVYWRLALSLALYRFNRTGRAQSHYQRGEEQARHGHTLRALAHKTLAGVLAPDVAFYAEVFPAAKRLLGGAGRSVLNRLVTPHHTAPQTAVYMDRADRWEDGWAGPRLVLQVPAGGGERTIELRGTADAKHLTRPLVLTVLLDGNPAGRVEIKQDGYFEHQIELGGPAHAGQHTIEIQANTWTVHHHVLKNGDYRPLAWRPAGYNPVVLR
jgi:glycosyltransferase involved in cell wall biosynthesis